MAMMISRSSNSINEQGKKFDPIPSHPLRCGNDQGKKFDPIPSHPLRCG